MNLGNSQSFLSIKFLRPIVALLSFLGFMGIGQCQVTLTPFTAPLSFSIQLPVGDGAQSGTVFASTSLEYSSISETGYYDPIANTLREVGSISTVNPSAAVSYQNIQNSIAANVTLNFSFPQEISFDTGVRENAGGFGIVVPLNGSYSLETGGETYIGSFSSFVSASTHLIFSEGASNTVTISMFNPAGDGRGSPLLADITAANGYRLHLVIGINGSTTGEGPHYSTAFDVDPVTFSYVPEPCATSLLCTAAVLGFLRRMGLRRYRR